MVIWAKVVSDHLKRRDVDDGGDGDSFGIAGNPHVVCVPQPGDAENRVATSWVQIELPTPLVMGRTGHGERDGVFEPEQSAAR
jgi:hypothetical protein